MKTKQKLMNWQDRKQMYNEEYLKRQFVPGHPYEETQKRIAEEFIELFNPKRVLDCGCAYGWLGRAFWVVDSNIDYYGFDLNKSAITLGKTEYPEIADKLLYLDAVEGFPFDDSFFDLVIAREFIEHIDTEHLMPVIGEMRRVVSSIMVITSPMIEWTGDNSDNPFLQFLLTLTKRHGTLKENLEAISKHPNIIPAFPTPDVEEHPNCHTRSFWIELFDLLGFDEMVVADKHYAPKRFDGLCGLNLLFFKRR